MDKLVIVYANPVKPYREVVLTPPMEVADAERLLIECRCVLKHLKLRRADPA